MALIQAITIEDHRYAQALRAVDFHQAHVFPGSFIPSVSAMLGAAARSSDLKLYNLEDLGPSYALTARGMARTQFHHARSDARALGFDERFLRLWDFYSPIARGDSANARPAACRCFGQARIAAARNSCRIAPRRERLVHPGPVSGTGSQRSPAPARGLWWPGRSSCSACCLCRCNCSLEPVAAARMRACSSAVSLLGFALDSDSSSNFGLMQFQARGAVAGLAPCGWSRCGRVFALTAQTTRSRSCTGRPALSALLGAVRRPVGVLGRGPRLALPWSFSARRCADARRDGDRLGAC
jgi:hypothetical protein